MENKKSGLAVAGLVLGIIAVVFSAIPVINYLAFIMGVLAAIFGLVCLGRKRSLGISITGVVLGIAAVAITIIVQSATAKAFDDTFGGLFDDVSSSSSQTAKQEDYGLNQTAVFKNIKVTATEIKESEGDGDGFFEPSDGNVYVGVKFVIENISDESQTISSILLFDPYVDNVKCEYSFFANTEFGDGTLDGEIAAGKRLEGWYAVEVPANWSKIDLDVKSSWLSSKAARFVFNK